MKKILLIIIISSGVLSQSYAQPLATVIKTQAIEMGKALSKNDMSAFKKYMHPDMLALAGDQDKMGVMADSAMKMFKMMGGSITKIMYGNPAEVVKFEKELQTTLSQSISLTSIIADVEFTSTLVAISRDGGKNWYFIDTSLYRESELRKKLPGLSPKLAIPPAAKPIIKPKAKTDG
jgi:hypothetical protein